MNRWILACLPLLLLTLAPKLQAQNLLLDPGFEISDGGTGAQNWGNWFNPGAGVTEQRVTNDAHSGLASANTHLTLNAQNDLGGWLQDISGWHVGDTLTASIWAKTNITGGAYAQLGFEAVGGGGILWGPSTAANNWTQLTQTIVVPAGTTQLKLIAFHANTANSTGDIWFDDATVTLAQVPEASSMALMGTGLLGLFGVVRRKLRK